MSILFVLTAEKKNMSERNIRAADFDLRTVYWNNAGQMQICSAVFIFRAAFHEMSVGCLGDWLQPKLFNCLTFIAKNAIIPILKHTLLEKSEGPCYSKK